MSTCMSQGDDSTYISQPTSTERASRDTPLLYKIFPPLQNYRCCSKDNILDKQVDMTSTINEGDVAILKAEH